MARADLNEIDGSGEYIVWSLVGNFTFSVSNGVLTARSTHRFNARNNSEDHFGCDVKYEHILKRWNGQQFVMVDNANVTRDFRLKRNTYYDNNKLKTDKGVEFVRETQYSCSPGERYFIEAYTNVMADPSAYDDCKAEENSTEFTVPA
ncbi:MAG: hypothetical protein OXT74_02215 [Candidatus Poribacteria bacterium]|nr:hypothetical protein [Candidatus Poribacteria bacterium]